MTALVWSRSDLRIAAPPGAIHALADEVKNSGMCRNPHTPMAATAPRRSRCVPTAGSDADATARASMWSAGLAVIIHRARRHVLGSGRGEPEGAVMAREYPRAVAPKRQRARVVYSVAQL